MRRENGSKESPGAQKSGMLVAKNSFSGNIEQIIKTPNDSAQPKILRYHIRHNQTIKTHGWTYKPGIKCQPEPFGISIRFFYLEFLLEFHLEFLNFTWNFNLIHPEKQGLPTHSKRTWKTINTSTKTITRTNENMQEKEFAI
jgi:hypothetical protein